jgi:hypothetical protein
MDISIKHMGVFTLLVKAAGKINLETAVEYGFVLFIGNNDFCL